MPNAYDHTGLRQNNILQQLTSKHLDSRLARNDDLITAWTNQWQPENSINALVEVALSLELNL